MRTHLSAAFWNRREREKKGGEEVGFGTVKEEKGSEGWRETDTRDWQLAANRSKRAAEERPAG